MGKRRTVRAVQTALLLVMVYQACCLQGMWQLSLGCGLGVFLLGLLDERRIRRAETGPGGTSGEPAAAGDQGMAGERRPAGQRRTAGWRLAAGPGAAFPETGRSADGPAFPETEHTADGTAFPEDDRWLKRQLSHNVRMPMAVIAGYGDLLRKGSFATREEETACIGRICSNIDYLNTFLKVALDDRPESGQGRREFFDLLACAREVAGYVRGMAAKAGVSVAVNSSRSEVQFLGSRVEVMRIFYNLFENSLKYMRREGGIFITIEENQEEILVVYRDEGEGMDETEAQRIMEPLYRGSNAGEPDGYGMGMYLIRRSVEENGGSIRIRSGKRKGMCIYMSFPCVRQEKGDGSNL